MSKRSKFGFPAVVVDVMQPINESIVCTAIRQCLETADQYVRRGNRREAEFYLDTADAYANRLIFYRQIDDVARRTAGAAGFLTLMSQYLDRPER